MKHFTRFLALLLAAALLPLSFVAAASAEEPVTITIWGSDRENMPFRNGLWTIDVLQEKLGIKIDIISAPTESLDEKFGLLMADPAHIPTIVQYKIDKLMKYKDAWTPLNDLVNETDTPNLWKVYSDPDIRRKVSDTEGNILFIGQRTAITCGKLFFYRQDWLDKLNLEAPKTTEDLYNVFKAIKEGDPNGNGEADEIPFAVRTNGDNKRGNVMPFIHNWGIAETFFAEDGKVKFGATDPRMKDALEWLARCYKEGLLDQEYLTRDKKAWFSAWANNQVFMSYDWSAYIDNVNNQCKDSEGINIVGTVPPEGPTGISETRDQLQPITVDEDWNAGIYIGASEEQKKAAMKLLDYVYSEEGMILMNFGEEGTHFNIVDGEYQYSDLIMHNPDGLSPQDALRQYGIQSMLTLLQDARYERAFVSDEVNRTRDIYEQEGHIGPAFPTLAFTNDEQAVINEKYTEIETYMNEMVDKFIMGVESLDKFDEYVAQVEKMGLADVLSVYQAAYDRYMN